MRIREVKRFSYRVYESVLHLLPQLDGDVDLPDEEFFRGILSSDNSHFFVAELDNKDIAGVLTLSNYDIPTGRKYWIEDVIVDNSLRGRGIGRDLVLHAIEYAGKAGAKSVELTSRPARVEANKLYRKLGFVLRETNMYRYNII
ncbi:MAG TPA: GNAT family N-acetyltransferase [Bacteroidales bacterium]|nr:GNAT family N-acetyltransferase [Bacteroidales bacterium]